MSQECPVVIDVQTVQALLSSEKIHLIDCREQQEWDLARIDSAVLIPMSRWLEETDRLEEMKDKPIVVHCHHGVRSLQVVAWLRQNGFPEAQSMAGGIESWSQQIDSGIPLY